MNILDDEATETQTRSQKQYEALQKFSAAMKEITDEPLDDEFFAIINSGVKIKKDHFGRIDGLQFENWNFV